MSAEDKSIYISKQNDDGSKTVYSIELQSENDFGLHIAMVTYFELEDGSKNVVETKAVKV